MEAPAHKEQLDTMKCQTPGCEHRDHDTEIFIRAGCHVEEPVWASYDSGILTLRCSVCDSVIIRVAVASNISPYREYLKSNSKKN